MAMMKYVGLNLLTVFLLTTTLRAAEVSGSTSSVEPAVVVESISTNFPPAGIKVAAANLSGYVPDDRYKLRAGDKVAFQILEDRDLPKSLVLADSGELDVPY